MQAIAAVVEQEKHYGGNYHGTSIFLPDPVWWTLKDRSGHYYKEKFRSTYVNLDFSVSAKWDEFLKALYTEWKE